MVIQVFPGNMVLTPGYLIDHLVPEGCPLSGACHFIDGTPGQVLKQMVAISAYLLFSCDFKITLSVFSGKAHVGICSLPQEALSVLLCHLSTIFMWNLPCLLLEILSLFCSY